MDQGGITWIVAADAEEARIFSERVRSGPLRELPDFHMQATDDERSAGQGQTATVHARAGARRHGAGGREPTHEAEARFLRRVANRLTIEAGRGAFDHLVLMGPPHALGALRLALPASLSGRVETADAHARKHDDAEAMRHHLRNVRARTWRDQDAM